MAYSSKVNIKSVGISWAVLAVAIALTLVACVVAVVLRLFSSSDLPFQTFAALIGVIITAIITAVLVKGQSEAERRQKEQAEIFKEKLATYNRFLNALCKYVTESTPTHKKEVIFHAMALRMHTNGDTIKELDANIVRLIDKAGTDDEVETLVKTLNAIATIFGKELYGETSDSPVNVDAFVAAISGSQEAPSEDEKLKDAAKEEKEDAAAVKDSKITAWSDKINALKVNGWKLTEGNDSFTLTSDSTPVVISVYRKKGKYIVEATKDGDNSFSQELKNNFNGYRRYGTWWRELPIGNYGVTDGTLLEQLPVNDKARASVIKWIDKLTSSTSKIQ